VKNIVKLRFGALWGAHRPSRWRVLGEGSSVKIEDEEQVKKKIKNFALGFNFPALSGPESQGTYNYREGLGGKGELGFMERQ